MEELQKLLPKYKLELIKINSYPDYILICYKNYCSAKHIYHVHDQILIYRFIHDNMKYIEDIIKLNGYIEISAMVYHKNCNKIRINLENIILYFNDINNIVLNDPNILFDKLREFLNIQPVYKPVIKYT